MFKKLRTKREMRMYNHMQRYRVEASSLEDFCTRYYKQDIQNGCKKELIKLCKKEFKKYGYAMIPALSSVTGEIVTYYG